MTSKYKNLPLKINQNANSSKGKHYIIPGAACVTHLQLEELQICSIQLYVYSVSYNQDASWHVK